MGFYARRVMPHIINLAMKNKDATRRRGDRVPRARCAVLIALLVMATSLLEQTAVNGEQIAVRYTEGVTHGFLLLRTQEGEIIAHGELNQVARNGRVTAHVLFRFKDGSSHEETTIFSQRGNFRLISNRVVQKGPSFKKPSDTFIEATRGQVTISFMDDGKEKTIRKRLELPSDIANGLVLTLAKNIKPGTPQLTVSMLVGTEKLRLVKLVISPQGEEAFEFGPISHKTVHYVVKVEIGGAAGAVASLVGKQPPDLHIWMVEGEAPTFLKSTGPFYEEGPIWRVELAAPKPGSKD